jgi:hypothetical protein
MRIFFRIGMAAAWLFLSLTAWAQECVPFEFWVVNQSDEGNTIVMNFAISNADGAVETDEIARELLNVWPNPASHSFQWKVPSDGTGGEWTVYAADGRLVHNERTTAQAGTWNVATWPCGLYHAIFVADGRQPLRQQLVVFR